MLDPKKLKTAISITLTVVALAQISAAQTFSLIYTFPGGTAGAEPNGALVRDSMGNLYGTTSTGGDLACSQSGCGTVFVIDSTGNATVLYAFSGIVNADGAYPTAGLVADGLGNFYGTTSTGGDAACNAGDGCGTVFKVNQSGNETILYRFTGIPDGRGPVGRLLLDNSGNLYGTTQAGGTYDLGTVFKLDGSGQLTILHSFAGGPSDGAEPQSGLIRDKKGNLYGTTQAGGQAGTVFKLPPAGKEVILYKFKSGIDGTGPYGPLVMDAQANLYGTTVGGGNLACGNHGCGTVFKLDQTRKHTVLHSFGGEPTDGSCPYDGLVLDRQGNLYGETILGGSLGFGTVFKLNRSGSETILHSFSSSDGNGPAGGLTRDSNGILYGSAIFGGVANDGTVFTVAP